MIYNTTISICAALIIMLVCDTCDMDSPGDADD